MEPGLDLRSPGLYPPGIPSSASGSPEISAGFSPPRKKTRKLCMPGASCSGGQTGCRGGGLCTELAPGSPHRPRSRAASCLAVPGTVGVRGTRSHVLFQGALWEGKGPAAVPPVPAAQVPSCPKTDWRGRVKGVHGTGGRAGRGGVVPRVVRK